MLRVLRIVATHWESLYTLEGVDGVGIELHVVVHEFRPRAYFELSYHSQGVTGRVGSELDENLVTVVLKEGEVVITKLGGIERLHPVVADKIVVGGGWFVDIDQRSFTSIGAGRDHKAKKRVETRTIVESPAVERRVVPVLGTSAQTIDGARASR
jgi:hypothetical protein